MTPEQELLLRQTNRAFRRILEKVDMIMKTLQDLSDSVTSLETEVGKLKLKPPVDTTPLVERVDAATRAVAAFNIANNPPAAPGNDSTSTDTPATPIARAIDVSAGDSTQAATT